MIRSLHPARHGGSSSRSQVGREVFLLPVQGRRCNFLGVCEFIVSGVLFSLRLTQRTECARGRERWLQGWRKNSAGIRGKFNARGPGESWLGSPHLKKCMASSAVRAKGSRGALPFLLRNSTSRSHPRVFSLPLILHTNISLSITVYIHVLSTTAWGTQANDCIAGIPALSVNTNTSFQTLPMTHHSSVPGDQTDGFFFWGAA